MSDIWSWFKKLFTCSSEQSDEWIPVSKTAAGKLWAILASGKCPDCRKKTKFLEGPHGGMSVNIKCASCSARFNITPAIGHAERIT